MARLFLIDGANLAYRSYFAFVREPLISSRGLNTSGVFGFAQTLLKLLDEERPDYLAVVWDPEEPTERHRKFADYKATRQKMPDEMEDQLPYLDRLVEGLRLPSIQVPGVEADDVIGTLARRAEARGLDVLIVSSDKDFLQIVTPRVKLYNLKKGWADLEVVGPDEVLAKWGVGPSGVRDVLGLMGDASDNIPGVPGVGEKTAAELVQRFGSLEGALERGPVEHPRKNIREALRASREQALLSKELVTLDTEAPGVDLDPLDRLARREPDPSVLVPLFLELEFDSLLQRVAPAKEVAREYEVVETEAALRDLVLRLGRSDVFAFDLETTGLSPLDAEIVGFSLAPGSEPAGKAYFVPTVRTSNQRLLFETVVDDAWLSQVLRALRPLLEDPRRPKGGQNVKYDILVLSTYGIDVRGVTFDTMIESYLCDPSLRQHNIDVLALRYLGVKKKRTEELIGRRGAPRGQKTMLDVPAVEIAKYACEDADLALRLHRLFEPKLKALEVERLYRDVEIPLLLVLARMERAGVKLDTAILGGLSAEYEAKIEALRKEIGELAGGEDFNIDSPKQLGPVLFERLEVHKLCGLKLKRTPKGTGYSTDQSFLDQLKAHPIVAKVLEYRQLQKLKGTYVDALPALVSKRTGLVHTSFNQAVAATGRLSSSNPNLQNIPIRGEEGRRIRAAFIPRAAENAILSADYSQIELRVLAHVTKDPTLVETFRRGEDVHRATAARVFAVAGGRPEAVTPDLRAKAKVINFGIIYGMGPQRLARETGMSLEEAQRFIAAYFEKFPGIKRYIDATVEQAERQGHVATILGRRRLIPEMHSPNPRIRAAARNMAVNTPIQGGAADIIKVAMVRIDAALSERRLAAHMVLQVHDELVFDVPERELAEVRAIVRECMERAVPDFEVPLRVDMGHGKNWLEAHA